MTQALDRPHGIVGPAESLLWLPITDIQEDAGQPRQEFPDEKQAALTESIAESGIKVPLLVRRRFDGTYQLTDGARRLRAARTVGLVEVPCVVSQDGGWLAVRHDQLLANAQRLDLTPLEDAQALYIIWLGRQIQALEAERGDAGTTTAQLIAESSTPTQQMTALAARLCSLADVPTVAAYLGGGPAQVRVTWQTVLQSIGRGDWESDRRKKHLAVLQLEPTVQDALAGLPISARTLREVAQLAPDAQHELVAQVITDTGAGDVGAALRAALAAPSPGASTADDGTAEQPWGEVSGFDVDLGLADEEPSVADDRPFALDVDGEQRTSFTPDRDLAMPFSTGPGQKLVSDRGPIGRGSTPPPGHERWVDDQALQISAGLEGLLHVFDTVGPKYFTDEQKGWLIIMWRELLEKMEQAGLSLDA